MSGRSKATHAKKQRSSSAPSAVPLKAVGADQAKPSDLYRRPDMRPAPIVPAPPAAHEPGPPSWWQRFRYNPWVFYPTVVLSLLIALAGLIFGMIQAGADFGAFSKQVKEWGLVREFPAERQGETLVVIARFHRSEGVADTEAHNEIRNAIEAAAKDIGEPNLRVVVSSVPIAADDQDRAEKLGKHYDASIVIWGADTGVRVIVNFLNLKHPDFAAAQVQINETQRTQLANPSAYVSFVTRDLPSQLSFLALFAVGQTYDIPAEYGKSIKVIEEGIAALASDSLPPDGLADAYFRLGWLYDASSQLEQAIDRYDRAIELDPQYARAFLNRGAARHDQGNLDVAIQDYTRAIELDPQFASAYNNRGIARGARYDFDGAIQDFTVALELEPEAPDTYCNRGNVYRDLGDLQTAIRDYTKAVESDPAYALAYYNRGTAHSDLGETSAALQDLTKAIELDPKYSDAYTNRGIVRKAEGDPEGAIQDYTRAIELAPGAVNAYNNRGNALYAMGELNAATQDYSKAIEIDPLYADAYNGRGTTRMAQGELNAASQDYNKAIELAPQSSNPYFGRAIVRGIQGNLAGALADFRRYLELQPNAFDRSYVEQRIAELEQQLNNP
jgi:tetratricopeptide (TPR) repeat protein